MIALLVTLLAASAPQQDSAVFVRRFVAAVNSASTTQRRALQHPKDVCSATEFVEEIMDRQHRRSIPRRYTWRIHRAPERMPFEGFVTYAVRPTHRLQLDYQTTPTSGVTVVVALVRDATGWYEVFGCPTAAALARMDSVKRLTDQRKLEVARRITSIAHEVRDSVLALHLNGRIVSATHYYAAAEKTDTTTADAVTDSIIARHRLVYKYEYPHNTPTLIEDHYIAIDTIDGVARGWYYGTTDDFDPGREGYAPGFFVAALRDFRFTRDSIAFSIELSPDLLFMEPLPLTVRDARIYPRDYRRWRAVPLSGSRTFRGSVKGDSISLVLGRETRIFQRAR